jgi:putative FmdB family regulatory protein
MPLYEYTCRRCRHGFEELVFGDATVACPACKAQDVERALSVFAVGGSDRPTSPSLSPCGSCGDPRGPGACKAS